MRKFFCENSLALVMLALTVLTMGGNVYTGWKDLNSELEDYHQPALSLGQYVTSGHCVESIFENWESEFLQMGLYVWLTVFLRQKGSSESKKLHGQEEVDREPSAQRPGAPWPVRRGGWVLAVYKNSLSLAFLLLFLLSFALHAAGGVRQYNAEQALKGKTEQLSYWQFLGSSTFWFQSMQNWQSEFLSVFAIVVLSIHLRQHGSPESKPVDAAADESGK